MTVISQPSHLRLRAKLLGLSLTVVKRGAAMQLHLQLSEPNAQIASLLTDWTVEGELHLARSVLPDDAEAAVIDLAALVRTLAPKAALTPV